MYTVACRNVDAVQDNRIKMPDVDFTSILINKRAVGVPPDPVFPVKDPPQEDSGALGVDCGVD